MDSFQSVLGDAAGGALCNVLSAYGASAPLLTAISLVEPTPLGEALAVGAGLAGLAASFGCSWDPNGQGPPSESDYLGCQKVENGYLVGRSGSGTPDNIVPTDPINFTGAIEIYEFRLLPDLSFGKYVVQWDILRSEPPGSPPVRQSGQNLYSSPPQNLYTYIDGSGTCVEPSPEKPPQPPTYTHTDPASGCQINVDFRGWGLRQDGNVSGIWEMAPALPATRTDSPITGCNFAPVIYIDGGGGGGGDGPVSFPVPDPLPPDGERPWWEEIARGAAWGLGEYVATNLLDQLFQTNYAGGNYELKGVCELDPDGNPMDVTRSTNYPPAPGIDAVLHRLDALAEMFQFDKDLRQPTCRQSGQTVTGQAVTINWRSDVRTPTGKNEARKRFTYFDQVDSTLEATVAHWQSFSWTAGPVIVNCLDTPLGKPQIWAVSLDEAKRVFAHAASIAGVDLSNARYEVSTPKDPRYGFTGLMRVDVLRNGAIAVTMRDGPSGPPPALG